MITKKDFKKLKNNLELLPEYVPVGYEIPKKFTDLSEKDHDILLIAIDNLEIDSFVNAL